MAKLPKDQPEEFRFKVPGVEVSGTGKKSSLHAIMLAYGIVIVYFAVALIGKACGWW